MRKPYEIITIFIFFFLFCCLFYSCTSGDRFKQYHVMTIETILKSLSHHKTQIVKQFSTIIAKVKDKESDLESLTGQWEIIYHYLERLNTEIQAHKLHLYTNNKTANSITTINTANGELINFALVNYTEVEVFIRLQDRLKLQKILEEIENNTLRQCDLIYDSMQIYHEIIN